MRPSDGRLTRHDKFNLHGHDRRRTTAPVCKPLRRCGERFRKEPGGERTGCCGYVNTKTRSKSIRPSPTPHPPLTTHSRLCRCRIRPLSRHHPAGQRPPPRLHPESLRHSRLPAGAHRRRGNRHQRLPRRPVPPRGKPVDLLPHLHDIHPRPDSALPPEGQAPTQPHRPLDVDVHVWRLCRHDRLLLLCRRRRAGSLPNCMHGRRTDRLRLPRHPQGRRIRLDAAAPPLLAARTHRQRLPPDVLPLPHRGDYLQL